MAEPLAIFTHIQVILSYTFGISINVHIVLAYVKGWKQNTKGQVLDQILLSTAITNILLQNFLTLDNIFYLYYIYVLYAKEMLIYVYILTILLIEYSFWNTSWLSVYYCLKLVKISHPFVLWMKARFSYFVCYILIGTALGSLAINLPFVWTMHVDFQDNVTNPTGNNYKIQMDLFYTIFDLMLGCFLPFFLSFVSLGLSVIYLLKHVLRMKNNGSQIPGPQTEGHIGAVRTMILRLILDLNFCVMIASSVTSEFSVSAAWGSVWWTLISFYPSVQSLVLILSNTKLKKKICCHWCL
ncbi:taste receptor type 2 member 7-like [Hyperolius riggenbachi]|uniref:taste receptor type 2 member 7-like n=1 Tax=Hyperolius riggenbachi TaxID=752182 RepID=UPI0035A35CAD